MTQPSDSKNQTDVTGFFDEESLELSWRYAYRSEFIPLLLDYLGARDGMNILDVGCGTSFLSRLLARHLDNVNIVGIDPDGELLDAAQGLLGREALSTEIQLGQGDAYRLPFPDETFDLVTSQTLL
jgi:ubiquinone/menaquinone biosynthesis C-methylase UbiE